MKHFTAVLLTSLFLSPPAISMEWTEHTNGSRYYLYSPFQAIKAGLGRLKVTLDKPQDTDASTPIGCNVSLSFSVKMEASELSSLPASAFGRCELQTNFGMQSYACHVHTLSQRSLQTITLSSKDTDQSFIADTLMFSEKITLRTEQLSQQTFQLSGVRDSLQSLSQWCRSEIQSNYGT